MNRTKIVRMKGKYEYVAEVLRNAKQFFKGGERVEQENINIQIQALIYDIKRGLKIAKANDKIFSVIDEAKKEFKEYLEENQYSNKFYSNAGKKVTYLQMQLFFDKIIDKVDYAISLEEPNFDMEKFRRQCKSIEGDMMYEIKKRKKRK